MPVGVAGADRHQRHRGAAGRDEPGVGVGAAVVGHLEHVGGQVGAGGDDRGLGLRAEVPGEQHPHPALGGPQHQAQVVGLGSGGRPVRIGGEDLERGPAHGPGLAGQQHLVDRAHAGQHPLELRHPLVGRCQRPGRDHVDRTAGQRTGQPTHVVGVQVRDQHERQAPDTEPVQAAGDEGTVGTGIDQHPLPRPGRQHQRVTLTDVAGDDHGVRERPAPGGLPDRPADDDHPDQRRERQRAQRWPADQRPRRSDQQPREQHRSPGAGRPPRRAVRHRRRVLGHHHQPAHRPARHPGQHVGSPGPDRLGQRGQQAQHGRGRHRRGGQQVGRQRHHADHAGQRGHQGRGHHPGSAAHREGLGQRTRQPAPPQLPGPAGSQEHDAGRGRHREREPGIGGQLRFHQQQEHDGGAQRRHRGPGPPGGQGEQRHPAHHRGAQHAGARPGQHDEGGDRQHGDGGLGAPVGGTGPQRPEHQADHDRDVGAGDGSQVGQPGSAELRGELRVHRAGVADDQTGEQPRWPVRQRPVRRGSEPGPQVPRCLLDPARPADRRRRRPGREHGQHVVAGFGRAHRSPQPHRLPGQQTRPLVGRPEQQHRVTGGRAAGDLEGGAGHQHPRTACAGEDPRVLVQLDHHLRHRAPGSQLGQRRGRSRLGADGGDRPDDGERREAADQHAGGRASRAQQQRCTAGGRSRSSPEQSGGQRRRQQGGCPDRGRRRHQPQVQPGPPLRRAHPPHRRPGPSPAHLRPAPGRRGRRRSPGRCR